MRPETPSQYLEKHLSQEMDEQSVTNAIRRLEVPFGEATYEGESKIEVKKEPFMVTLEYTEIRPDNPVLDKTRDTHVVLYRVDELTINRTDVGTLSISAFVPEGWHVYFDPSETEETSYADLHEKMIVLRRDPLQPIGLLTLLHEIGHTYESEMPKEFTQETFENRNTFDQTDLAAKLQSERDAWAFAFKKIRPFLDASPTNGFSIQRQDALVYAKKYALQSYDIWVRSQQSERRTMTDFAKDYYDLDQPDWWDLEVEEEKT